MQHLCLRCHCWWLLMKWWSHERISPLSSCLLDFLQPSLCFFFLLTGRPYPNYQASVWYHAASLRTPPYVGQDRRRVEESPFCLLPVPTDKMTLQLLFQGKNAACCFFQYTTCHCHVVIWMNVFFWEEMELCRLHSRCSIPSVVLPCCTPDSDSLQVLHVNEQ